MRTRLAASFLCTAALLIGCSATQKQAEVSPGAVDGSQACSQATAACSPMCPAAAKAHDTASPGAVCGSKTGKACCSKTKAAGTATCPSMQAKETAPQADATVSPGALGDRTCCPPCPKCPKCPAHPDGCPPCPPCPPGCCS